MKARTARAPTLPFAPVVRIRTSAHRSDQTGLSRFPADFRHKSCTLCVNPQEEAGQASWPFGQCPVYTDGDFHIAQSDAILRYIARQHGLYGSGIKEETQIDSFLQGVEDLRRRARSPQLIDLRPGTPGASRETKLTSRQSTPPAVWSPPRRSPPAGRTRLSSTCQSSSRPLWRSSIRSTSILLARAGATARAAHPSGGLCVVHGWSMGASSSDAWTPFLACSFPRRRRPLRLSRRLPEAERRRRRVRCWQLRFCGGYPALRSDGHILPGGALPEAAGTACAGPRRTALACFLLDAPAVSEGVVC